MNATDKQVTFALSLLAKKGYPTKYMSAQFKQLGALSSERSGTVQDWLKKMTVADCSALIEKLK